MPAYDSWRMDRRVPELVAAISENMIAAIGLRWRLDLGAPIRCSPIFGYGKLFIGTDDNKVHAINPYRGTTHWTYEASDKVSTCPLVQQLIGVGYPMLWFTTDDGFLHALNANTGGFLWSLEGGGTAGNSAITGQVPRTVFYTYSDGFLSATRAVEAVNGEVIWESQKYNNSTAMPLVIHHLDLLLQGHVQGGTVVTAYRTTDGTPIWTLRSEEATSGAYTSGVLGGDERYYISMKNASVAGYVVRNQYKRWETNLPHVGQVTGFTLKQQVGDDFLIVTQSSHMYCLNAETGEILWQVSHGGNVIDPTTLRTTMPAIYGDIVFGVENGVKLTARRIDDAEEVWHFILDGSVISSPALSDRSIAIATNSGSLYMFYGCPQFLFLPTILKKVFRLNYEA
jgi:outer membrane protein assembly factor BamB